MNPRVLTTAELSEITGYHRTGDVARCLRQQGIVFFYGKDGIVWTTVDLVNAAGGLRGASDDDALYPVDVILPA